jgi:hypothetical protein
MLSPLQHFLLFSFLIIYFITNEAQSIEADRHLETTLANYRHRFERSMNIKKLQWTAGKALCEACDLLVPEVISILKDNVS